MNERDAVEETKVGWDLLFSQARVIAMLPLEEWLAAFERAETLGAVLDPTLFRDYLQDPEKKGEIIKDVIRSALPLKRAVLKWRQQHIANGEKKPASRGPDYTPRDDSGPI